MYSRSLPRTSDFNKVLQGLFAAAVVGAVAAAFWVPAARGTPGCFPAPLDDVYIYFDFARATGRGCFLCHAVGNGYSTGATSPTYALVLALGWSIGFREQALGAFAAVVGLVSVWDLSRSISRLLPKPAFLGWLTPVALVALPALSWSWFSGMEAAFAGAVLGRALVATSRATTAAPHARRAAQKSAGAWAALLAVSRPECAPLSLALAIAVAHAAGSLSAAASLARAAGPTCAAVLGLAALSRATTGEVAAAGALRKLVTSDPYASGLDAASVVLRNAMRLGTEGFDVAFGGTAAMRGIQLLALASLASRRTRRLGAALLIGAAGAFALVCLNTTAPFQNLRYLVPTWTMLIVAALLGVGATAARGRWLQLSAGAVALLSLGSAARTFPRQLEHFAKSSRNIHDQQVEVGRRIGALVPRPSRVMVGDAGAIPYLSDVAPLDGLGLGGYRDLPFARASVHGLPAVVELIERMPEAERPDVLAIYDAWWPGLGQRFGHELFRVRIEDNVICADPEKAVYRADWSKLEDRAALEHGTVDRIDVGDLVDEREHHVRFTTPRAGYVVQGEHADASGRVVWDAGRVLSAGQWIELDVLRAPSGPADVSCVTDGEPAAQVLLRNGTRELRGTVPGPSQDDRWSRVTFRVPELAPRDRLRLEVESGALRCFSIEVRAADESAVPRAVDPR